MSCPPSTANLRPNKAALRMMKIAADYYLPDTKHNCRLTVHTSTDPLHSAQQSVLSPSRMRSQTAGWGRPPPAAGDIANTRVHDAGGPRAAGCWQHHQYPLPGDITASASGRMLATSHIHTCSLASGQRHHRCTSAARAPGGRAPRRPIAPPRGAPAGLQRPVI